MRSFIFDFNGTLYLDKELHRMAWKQFMAEHGIHVTDDDFEKHMYGPANGAIVQHFMGSDLPQELVTRYAADKEAIYRQIAMADPSSSGSAYTQLNTILMIYGQVDDDYAAGWEMVKSMMKNLVIQSGSSGAHKNVDSGEYPIGITLEKAAVQYDLEGGHLKMIYPEDGTSAVPDGIAIVKDCKNLELAQLFVEYALSADTQAAQNKDFGRRPIRSDVTPVGLNPLGDITLMNYNFDYAGANKADIVEKWQDAVVGD